MPTTTLNYQDKLFRKTLQSAATATGNGTILSCLGSPGGPLALDLTAFCKWSAGCNGGEVTLEEADAPDYAGTWAIVAIFAFKNGAIDFSRYSGCFAALRMRISQTVTGGTVTAETFGAVRRW